MYYDTIQIGIRIKALRKRQGFTQEKLAECLNVTDKHIRNLEQGQYGASLDLLIEMAEFFGVSLDYLILGKRRPGEELKQKLHSLITLLVEVEKSL